MAAYDTALTQLRELAGMNNYKSTQVMQNLKMEKDTGIKYSDLKEAYTSGKIDFETAASYKMVYGGADEDEACLFA